jgi:hypothetical protein
MGCGTPVFANLSAQESNGLEGQSSINVFKETGSPGSTQPSVAADAALSFLKETKGLLTWSASDLANSLKIARPDAEQVIALLEAQGYAKPASEAHQFMTTPAGDAVSNAKPPRFTPKYVEQALVGLMDRITELNKDATAPFKITAAVAFGDFLLSDRARVQAADVGIRLVRRSESGSEPRSASEARAERQFLRTLRGRTSFLNFRPYADWMRKRLHRALV